MVMDLADRASLPTINEVVVKQAAVAASPTWKATNRGALYDLLLVLAQSLDFQGLGFHSFKVLGPQSSHSVFSPFQYFIRKVNNPLNKKHIHQIKF